MLGSEPDPFLLVEGLRCDKVNLDPLFLTRVEMDFVNNSNGMRTLGLLLVRRASVC